LPRLKQKRAGTPLAEADLLLQKNLTV